MAPTPISRRGSPDRPKTRHESPGRHRSSLRRSAGEAAVKRRPGRWRLLAAWVRGGHKRVAREGARSDSRGGAFPTHGHAGRPPHVGRHDQLWSPRLGQRPARLSLRRCGSRHRPPLAARCPRSFSTSRSVLRPKAGIEPSSPTPASSIATSRAAGSLCIRIETSGTSTPPLSRSRWACPRSFSLVGTRAPIERSRCASFMAMSPSGAALRVSPFMESPRSRTAIIRRGAGKEST